MAEQILSQEEIDALLNAMDNGEVDVEQGAAHKPQAEARAYDLTSQSLSLRDQFDALDEVYDKFVNLLNVSLTGSLQRTIEVKLASKEIVKFGDYLRAFTHPTGFSVFSMEPFIGSALLGVEPKLGFALIDCMFGGVGRPLARVREFTQIEQRILSRFYSDVLVEMERAWQVAYKIKVTQLRTETKPEYVNLVSPNDLVIVVFFSISGDEFSGNINFCTPFLMLEPIKEKLSSRYLREKDRAHAFRSQLSILLKDTKLNLVAELGKTASTIGQILELEKGDIVKLNCGPQDPLVLKVEEQPKYFGLPGVVKGNRAVQITSLIYKEQGE
jgi:flagellar motor switch protein FliM